MPLSLQCVGNIRGFSLFNKLTLFRLVKLWVILGISLNLANARSDVFHNFSVDVYNLMIYSQSAC